MNKLNVYICLALVSMMLWACTNDYEAPSPEPNHFSVYVSEENFANAIQVNGDIDFGDVSRGVVSRTWTFPSGKVNIAGSENDETSSEAIVKAIFLETGIFEVKLHQEFASDAFVESELRASSIDTTYMITVYDSVRASFTAQQRLFDGADGGPITVANGAAASNKMEAGGSIVFNSTSTGEPAEHKWILPGGDPAEFIPNPQSDGSEIEVKYKRLGTYDVMLISSRGRPFGADTVVFENMVEIIPSTAPVLVDDAFVTEDGLIALNFSRELKNPAAEAANFSITIENEGRVINPAIASLTLDKDFNNIMYIELDNEVLYNTDNVTLSYTQGTLTSSDFYLVDSFSDIVVKPYQVNILAEGAYDFGFESGDAGRWPYDWWGGVWGEYSLEVSDARAAEGAYSGHLIWNAAGGSIFRHNDGSGTTATFPLEKDVKYKIQISFYVESLGDKSWTPAMHFYAMPNTDWGVAGFNFEPDFPEGEWVNRSIEFVSTGTEAASHFAIRGWNEFNSQPLDMYMDNIQLVRLNERP